MIKLYNSLTRKKETFKSIKKGEVGLYTCGPTVYWYQHIGNLRTYIFSDLLKRSLTYNGLKIKQVINITDVGHLTSDADDGDDKMELAAAKEGKTASDIANYYFDIFHNDLKRLNIIDPNKWTKATDHIKEQIELIKELEKKGYTYKTSDGIYFDTSKVKDYGKLAGINIEGIKAGKRVAVGEKMNKTDFALWKFSEDPGKRQQEWNPKDYGADWPVGFPGWHVECSAMSIKYLGEHFDIHTGGEDHRQLHHPNEIAQSEGATGKKFVNYWLHGAFLLDKEGKKASKSTGGLYTLSELEQQGYHPMHYRYFCLLTHYRKPLTFNFENLDAAKAGFDKLKRKVIELKETIHKGSDKTKEYEKDFLEAVNDDLNIPLAVQVFIKCLDDIAFDSKKRLKLLEKFDSVLGIGVAEMKEEKIKLPKEVSELVNEREKARKAKMWADSDKLRNKIKELGYTVSDTSEGPKVEKI